MVAGTIQHTEHTTHMAVAAYTTVHIIVIMVIDRTVQHTDQPLAVALEIPTATVP